MSRRLFPASIFAGLLLFTQFAPAAAPPCASTIRDGLEDWVLIPLNEPEPEGSASINEDAIQGATEKEKKLERRLFVPCSVRFDGTPLRSVIDELRDINGINIVFDDPALQAAGISLERPITIEFERLSLKSALNLILNKVHLTYRIKDDAVQITTEEEAQCKFVTVTYSVADLIGRPLSTWESILPCKILKKGEAPPNIGNAPYFRSRAVVGASGSGKPGKIMKEDEENVLIDSLICSIVQPHTWTSVGGRGTIDYFPLTQTLVINQTTDIQEQVADLLAALRRLCKDSDEHKPVRSGP